MDQAAWKAVCNYYNRVFKRIDPDAKMKVFRQNVDSVLEKLPTCDRNALLNYWKEVGEATHPFQGTKHPAPIFVLDTNFTANTLGRATGMATCQGCAFVFEVRVMHTAPNELAQCLIAHELAHAVLHVNFRHKGLPLPAPKSMPSAEQYSEYPDWARNEEALVHEVTSGWGFPEHLLELWEIAVEDAPKDPHSLYRQLKNRIGSKLCLA